MVWSRNFKQVEHSKELNFGNVAILSTVEILKYWL
jgi:hypothetical protein